MIGRRDFIFTAGCVAAAGGAWALTPRRRVSLLGARRLTNIVPTSFPDWTSTDTSDLVSAVRRVAAGESLLDPALTRQVMERLRGENVEDEHLARLTPQERNILELIADGKTNRQIADELYLAEKTVKNYVSNLLSKMGFARRTEAAVYAAVLAERKHKT